MMTSKAKKFVILAIILAFCVYQAADHFIPTSILTDDDVYGVVATQTKAGLEHETIDDFSEEETRQLAEILSRYKVHGKYGAAISWGEGDWSIMIANGHSNIVTDDIQMIVSGDECFFVMKAKGKYKKNWVAYKGAELAAEVRAFLEQH